MVVPSSKLHSLIFLMPPVLSWQDQLTQLIKIISAHFALGNPNIPEEMAGILMLVTPGQVFTVSNVFKIHD